MRCALTILCLCAAAAMATLAAAQPERTTDDERAQWEAFRARVQEFRRGGPQARGAVPQDDADRALREKVTRLSQLMRQEYQGMTRRNVISEAEHREIQRGLSSTDLVPLTEMGESDRYKSQPGGLYGRGQNDPPESHLNAARNALAQIQPLDAEGRPAANGKIVLLCVGMSNTHGTFSRFQKIVPSDAEVSPRVVLVDGASGGQHALSWADPEGRHARAPRVPAATGGSREADSWDYAEHQIRQADATPAQVQVIWMKQAIMNPANYGEFPSHADILQESMALILQNAARRYPNLRLAFVSSRTYGGYAVRELNPEPYAYESGFAVRRLIQQQIDGHPELNWDPQRGPVRSPVLVWGPYLWADGLTPRKSDGLTYTREDYAAPPDGTHPSDQGYDKVARQLLTFFKTDPLARPWFVKSP